MRPERFTAWILATALCAAAPAVQGAPDAATRTSAATALSLQDARTRLLQVSDQLAAARAAVESKRLQTQGLQGLGGPIVGLSASHTRYSLHGELDPATGCPNWARCCPPSARWPSPWGSWPPACPRRFPMRCPTT